MESPLALYSAKTWVCISSYSFIIFVPPHRIPQWAKIIVRQWLTSLHDIPNLFYREVKMSIKNKYFLKATFLVLILNPHILDIRGTSVFECPGDSLYKRYEIPWEVAKQSKSFSVKVPAPYGILCRQKIMKQYHNYEIQTRIMAEFKATGDSTMLWLRLANLMKEPISKVFLYKRPGGI